MGMIKIVGVGDIMPGGLLSGNGQECATRAVLDRLAAGDVRCGTLECAFGNSPAYDEAKVADRGNVIYAKDADVRRLKELDMNVVSLANNHFFDLGAEGAAHTIELLDREGILHCGAGANLQEAGRPAVVTIGRRRVAFLAFCDTDYDNVYYCTYATESSPGVNPMRMDYVVSEIERTKKRYDHVVVLAHWGKEHTFYPNIMVDKMAKAMQKAGACLVLGSHPHQVQPVINTWHGGVAYSMGNFLFPERLIAPPKVTYYPEEPLDMAALPVTEEYPVVDRITLKTLPYFARVGMIATAGIVGHAAVLRYRLTYLNKNNCVELLGRAKGRYFRKTMRGMSVPLVCGYYKFYKKRLRAKQRAE